jgi:hypothetical protein
VAKRVSTYDEAALCRILLKISLLDSAYQALAHPMMCSSALPNAIEWMSKNYRPTDTFFVERN